MASVESLTVFRGVTKRAVFTQQPTNKRKGEKEDCTADTQAGGYAPNRPRQTLHRQVPSDPASQGFAI